MKLFTNKQLAELNKSYAELSEMAEAKTLRFNLYISMYGRQNQDKPFSAVAIGISDCTDEDSPYIFYRNITSAGIVSKKESQIRFDRNNDHRWYGLIAALEAAEDFIKTFKREGE